MFVLVSALCLGIFLACHVKIPLWCIYSLVCACFIFCRLRSQKELIFDVGLVCLFFLLGATLLKNHDARPYCHINRYVYLAQKPCTIKGLLLCEPQSGFGRTIFVLQTTAITSRPGRSHCCCGKVLVRFKGKKELHYGDELLLRGSLYRPFKSRPGSRQSYRDYLYNQGIYCIISVKSDLDLAVLNTGKGFFLKRLALGMKQKIEKIFHRYTNPVCASILEAMILGEKKNIPALVAGSMMKTGTMHILVVSGFNVGIVAALALMFLKMLRISRFPRYIVTSIFLFIYCLATGASTPVVRATIMAGMFMSAFFIQRDADIYNSLALACLFILWHNPRQIFDIGFQLSFISVLAIVFLYPKIKSFLRLETIKNRCVNFFIDGLLVSFSAWLGTLGLIGHYFRIFSPVTVLANLLIVPLAALITLSGFSLIIVHFACPALAVFFASSIELICALLIKINLFLAQIPGACVHL